MPGSPLEEYSRNYGAKLRAALNGQQSALVADPNAPRGSPNGRPEMGDMNPMDDQQMRREEGSALENGQGPYVPPQDPTVPVEPGGTADPEGGQDMGGPNASPMQQGGAEAPGSALDKKGGGYGFRQMWKDAPERAKEKELTKLETNLKQGNQTIDQAYDDLEKQLGTRPGKKKLSRQEKGMLLMEFGLNVLANNKKGFGAVGHAGGKALQGYNEMSMGPQKDYDATLGSVRGARARDKVDLAKQSALEGVKVAKDQVARLPGRFVGEDGNVFFYDEMGETKQALDEQGKPIKASLGERNGAGGKEFESDAKYSRYMEIYGVDSRTGEPLSGLALQKAKQDALDFANDRGASIDDLDLDILAETSADKEMGADAYRDLTPDQREAQRDKIAKARRSRLKRPLRSALEPAPEPTRGRGRTTRRRFVSEADAKSAFQRGEIAVGDVIIVNGVEGPVE